MTAAPSIVETITTASRLLDEAHLALRRVPEDRYAVPRARLRLEAAQARLAGALELLAGAG